MGQADLVTQDDHGTPLRWRTPAGVMHAVERVMGAGDPRLFSSRTRCGRDIHPLETWAGRDTLSCQRCFDIEYADRMRHDRAGHAHGH